MLMVSLRFRTQARLIDSTSKTTLLPYLMKQNHTKHVGAKQQALPTVIHFPFPFVPWSVLYPASFYEFRFEFCCCTSLCYPYLLGFVLLLILSCRFYFCYVFLLVYRFALRFAFFLLVETRSIHEMQDANDHTYSLETGSWLQLKANT